MKKIYREKNGSFLGVLGGFGKYWDVDPVYLRALFVLFVLVTGIFPGVVGYFIVAMIMPIETEKTTP